MTTHFYTKDTIAQARWPETALGEFGQSYLTSLIQQGPQHFANNLHADMALIIINDKVLPIYINNQQDRDCYLVSPSCFYFLCGAEAFQDSTHWGYKVLFSFIKGLSHATRFVSFDKTVHINNWLMPTNPSQSLNDEEIKALKACLAEHYPKHAWLFKSINAHYTPDALKQLEQHDFMSLRTRLVYMWNDHDIISKNRRYLKKDEALLNEPSVEIKTGVEPEQSAALRSLYNQVYLDKHSIYNPAFNDAYFQLLTQSPHVNTVVAYTENNIQGFYTRLVFAREQILGIVGHDHETNEAKSIYRRLFSHCLKASHADGVINLSGGIGQFKRNRGAKAVAEYDACHVKHLPFPQRVLWKALSWATQLPLMEKIARDV